MKELFELGLPKWPAIVVKGESVTEEQAIEIIIKTDQSLPDMGYACNNDSYNRLVSSFFGIQDRDSHNEDWELYFSDVNELSKALGKVGLVYLSNDRIASSYVGGPNGWCDLKGNISLNSKNIGKWPSVEEVYEDWVSIAKAFPYLKLRSQLFDREECEEGHQVVIEFKVQGGEVEVLKPVEPMEVVSEGVDEYMEGLLNGTSSEIGIPSHKLHEHLVKLYGEIPQLRLAK
ncbi:hypothetical protein DRO66_03760 [Candidatus Bathyarchaeota archaeon]|nr:MAG: hypothetical protein DRO66_03760 [Candidatus Bathyarchaeota archaeon]